MKVSPTAMFSTAATLMRAASFYYAVLSRFCTVGTDMRIVNRAKMLSLRRCKGSNKLKSPSMRANCAPFPPPQRPGYRMPCLRNAALCKAVKEPYVGLADSMFMNTACRMCFSEKQW